LTSIAPVWGSKRSYATPAEEGLKTVLRRIVPEKRELLKKVKAVSDKKLGDCKVENALGGMR
jgi:citrate synthase